MNIVVLVVFTIDIILNFVVAFETVNQSLNQAK